MRVGPSKEYGVTSTITLRFRTLGMTLSRGKSPQAERNSPPSLTFFLKQCSFLFIIDPSAHHFFSATNFCHSLTTSSVLSLSLLRIIIFSLINSLLIRVTEPLPSNLIHFSFAHDPRSRVFVAAPSGVFSNF